MKLHNRNSVVIYTIIFVTASIIAGCTVSSPHNADGDGDYFVMDSDSPPVDWGACEVNSDCVLALNGDCCPDGVQTFTTVDAVNHRYLSEHSRDVCQFPSHGCEDPGGEMRVVPWLFATCDEGQCLVVTLQEQIDLTECEEESVCVLRNPTCCECDSDPSGAAVIGLRADQVSAYEELVCDGTEECPDCALTYNETHQTTCEEDMGMGIYCWHESR